MNPKKERMLVICLVGFFFLCGLLLSLVRPPEELPLDSRSNGPDGLRMLYLTLEDLGFSVKRKTGPIGRTGVGVILVFGPEYLAGEKLDAVGNWEDAGGVYIELEDAGWYINSQLNAETVWMTAYELWPYRDMTIWFDEYGRSAVPASGNAAALTPVNILPVWVIVMLWQVGILTLLTLFFYNVRLGSPVRTERSRRQDERDDAQALANLMERSRLLPDALRLCYRRLVENTDSSFPKLEQACECPPSDPDRALVLAAEMDRLIRNSKNDPFYTAPHQKTGIRQNV